MCSARAEEVTAKRRILDAAIALIGAEGVRAATVRRVADAAEVSPALILHHFGSKSGMVAACDAAIIERISALTDVIAADGTPGGFQEIFGADDMGDVVAYIARAIQQPGDTGAAWFDQFVAMTIGLTEQMEADGRALPSSDPMMRAVLMIAMDLGVVFMRSNVERLFGASITSPEIINRWTRAEFELLNDGVFITPEED